MIRHERINGRDQADDNDKTRCYQHSSQEKYLFGLVIQFMKKTVEFMGLEIVRTEFQQQGQIIVDSLLDTEQTPVQMICSFEKLHKKENCVRLLRNENTKKNS